MTDYSKPNPQAPDHRPTHTDEAAATRDDSPRVAAAVPITVWRLDHRDDDHAATESGHGFASRLARRLVLVYTSHGETVVDLDNDIHLHRAATTTGRSYLAGIEATCSAGLDQISQPVSLVTLRWPHTADRPNAHQLAELLTACRLIMSGGASLVAAAGPGDPAEPGPRFADHEHALRTAAEAAGLQHVLQIVAISAPGDGDQFLYYASRAEVTDAVSQATTADGGEALHIDLLVFATRTISSDGLKKPRPEQQP